MTPVSLLKMATEEPPLTSLYGKNPVAEKSIIETPSKDSNKLGLDLFTKKDSCANSDVDFESLQKRYADGKDDLLETEVEEFSSDEEMNTSSSLLLSSQTSQVSQDSQNSQDLWSNVLSKLPATQLPTKPQVSVEKEPETNGDKLNTIIGLLNGKLLPEQRQLEKQTNSLIANQRQITLKINELTNEVQRSKSFTRCKINELVKDNIDREYERCNLVIYDLNISDWNNYMSIYKKPQKAVFHLGLNFVRTFMNYDHRDLSVSKLVQEPGKDGTAKKDHKHFRILLKMATPDDALRLKKRCFKRGFYTLRNGLTRKEREICTIIQQRCDEWNQKLDANSDTMFVRKFLFNIAEVQRNDTKKIVKWHESLESAEQYFESKISALAQIPIEMTKKTVSLPPPASKASEPIPQGNVRNEWLPNLETPGTKPSAKSASLPSKSPPSFNNLQTGGGSRKFVEKSNIEASLGLTLSGIKRKATSPSHPLSPSGHPPKKRGRKPLSIAQKEANAKKNKLKREAIKREKAKAEKEEKEELARLQNEAKDAIRLMAQYREEVEKLRASSGHKDTDA